MMPLPGRRLASMLIRRNGRLMLIDCGEGTQVNVREAGHSLARIDAIFLTHFHADHVAGLPGLLLSAGTSGRTESVTLYGPRGLRQVVSCLRVIAPELPYELVLRELHGETAHMFEDVQLTFFELSHIIPCYGCTFKLNRPGKFDAERAKAQGIPIGYWKILQRGDNAEHYTPDMVLGPARKGIKFAYMTDTRPIKGIGPIEGADLLVCEGTYGEADKADKANKYGHMTFTQAAELAARANAKRLVLTHFSPSMNNPEDYIENARHVFPNADAAMDLMNMPLLYPLE